MGLRDFVKNHEDMSDDNGFQFKFFCDICGDGYLTRYKEAPFAKAKSVARVAEGLGALLGRSTYGAGSTMDALQDAKWREAKERAFDEAVAEARGHFTKCPGCAKYVCASCWNDQALMCVDCAPREAVVVQKARARAFQATTEQVMASKDLTAEVAAAEGSLIKCPVCGKPTTLGKFCEACGAPLDKKACPNCGAKLSISARFCGNCGTRLS